MGPFRLRSHLQGGRAQETYLVPEPDPPPTYGPTTPSSLFNPPLRAVSARKPKGTLVEFRLCRICGRPGPGWKGNTSDPEMDSDV